MEFPKPTNRQTAKEKQRSRYETLIFTRLVLLVAVPLLIVGLLCGILYYRSEPARGRAKLGEVAGNASMRMTSVFDGLRSYYLAALRNSSFTWMESCSEIPYSRYSDLRDAQELLRGGTYMDSEEKGVRGYERMFYLQRLVSTLLMVAENAGLSVSKVLSNHSDNLFAEISRIYSNDKMRTFLVEEVAVPVMDLLGNFRRDNTSELVKNVIALIKQTNGDLTLNECAEKLNYSASYIWKVLKNERNTNFTDLVASQKLEMAKELLLTTDMSVAQVADTLHYSNVQNFIRFFSREVGMTPGKYKKEYQTGKKKP